MSLEQSTELAAGARRRIVALPTRIQAPVALIMREAEQREALTDHLGRRRVVSFPSLAHFCTEEQRRQPWLGIVVGYSCAWDAQLDRYVPHSSCISLYQVPEEGHGWPEGVQRISERDQLDAWLLDLAEPMPAWKKALEEARKKPRKPKRVPARAEAAQLSLPMSPESSRPGGASTPSLEAGSFSHRGAGTEAAPRRQKVVTKRIVKPAAPAAARGRSAAGDARPASREPSSARAPKGALRQQATPRPSVTLSARDLAAAARAGAHLPRELIRLASEIGFVRALQLLNGLQQNARSLTRGRSAP